MRPRVHLAGLLERFEARTPGEAGDRASMLALARRGLEPFSAEQHMPGHFTISALVLDPEGLHLLLIEDPGQGGWSLPRTLMAPDERDVVVCARRALWEQAGLGSLTLLGDAALDLAVETVPASSDKPAHKRFDVRLCFRALAPATPDVGLYDIAWLSPASTLRNISDARLRRSLARLPAHLSRHLEPVRH
jgi:8-oxo-dGTP pyrophosphatase MutT (NUDIX family)